MPQTYEATVGVVIICISSTSKNAENKSLNNEKQLFIIYTFIAICYMMLTFHTAS